MFVTELVSQVSNGWLNTRASENMAYILVTWLTCAEIDTCKDRSEAFLTASISVRNESLELVFRPRGVAARHCS